MRLDRLLRCLALGGAACATVLVSVQSDARTPKEAARIAAVTSPTTDFSAPEQFELHPGGAATSFKPLNISVFSQPSANMSFERELDFKVGDGIFRKLWVSAPSSTTSSDGLGPLFNARSCQSCHLKDGRGAPPAAGEPASSLLLRLSIPPKTDEQRRLVTVEHASVIPEPVYGGQLQNFSVQGVPAEGNPVVSIETVSVRLADGAVVELEKPTWRVEDLAYGPMHPQTMISPRIAPPMIGVGLLEAIDEADILALADPDDRDGDGISGRPNIVFSTETQKATLGRFGWKAGEPTIPQQTAHAFANDIGLSSPLADAMWGDCTDAQAACRAAPHGAEKGEFEVPPQMFDLVNFYSRNLAVPARRDIDDPEVLRGKALFYGSGCTGCHRPKFVTRRDSIEPEQSFQLIWPYTDMLLHDMGEGLADHRPESAASGTEWRTAPLWGIGLTETVSGHMRLLHDGRARGLLEAILWHGGEAQKARDAVVGMSKEEREALLAFLRSL